MNQVERIHLRTTEEFKESTRQILQELYDLGIRDNQNLSQYVIAAVREKRERDRALIQKQWAESGLRRVG